MYTKKQQKENRKLWIAALRSGKYIQGRQQLRTLDNRFCCLGVLCEVAKIKPTKGYNSWFYDGDACCLGDKAMEFVGIKESFGVYSQGSLSGLNDCHTTFEKIADIIESEPKGLFE